MSERPSKPGAIPRPKPSVPGAPKPPPPPPSSARRPPPPPPPTPREANPFLAESSSKIDAGWLALEDATEEASPEPEPELEPELEPEPEPEPEPIAPVPPEPAPPAPSEPPEPKPSEPPPFEKKSRGKRIALAVLAVVAIAGGGFAVQSQMAARASRTQAAAPPPIETTAEPVLTAEPPPPPTHTAESRPSASAAPKKPGPGGAAPAVSIDPASRAYLDATQIPPGRKIVVDGRVVGTSPRKVAVRCGRHRVQIGDLTPESIDFPCGGEVNFTE